MTYIVEWNERYSVDVPELDACQKELMAMFNALIVMKENKSEARDVASLVTEINDFTRSFFAREEKLLGMKGYPDLDTHSRAHRQFIKKTIGLRRDIADDADNLTIEDIAALRQCLVSHFESLDTLFIPFLRIHRYVDACENKR